MTKKYAAFSLNEAVCGISNDGIEYDEHTFNLFKTHHGVFNTKDECEKQISESLLDYKQRIKDNKTRFVILEVYCQDDDKVFNQ